MLYLLIILGVLEKQIQTNWMGGAGVQGPVTKWNTRYYQSDSVTVAIEGQLSLIATQWDYSASGWVKHIVESNSGIGDHAQGFMPADIDNDGIEDLVAPTNDSVVWYKNDGNYNFTKNIIGPAISNVGSGYVVPCVYPCDLDEDRDVDVLVAVRVMGLGWYENNGVSWAWHSLDSSIGYHRASTTDVELDGDIDIIAVDNSSDVHAGDIYLFRNDGSQNFVKELVAELPNWEGWRVYPADFNGDGYDDLYSANWLGIYVFLNDKTGTFTQSFYNAYWSGQDFDGTWASDIDMDGDMDLVCVDGYHSPYGVYGLLNNGVGNNFDTTFLVEDLAGAYGDGGMVGDINLDGLPDIIGTYTKVGYFRQTGALAFVEYKIDSLVTASHWGYAVPLSRCTKSVDLLVTRQGEHIVYENKMLKKFANSGYLTSLILELADTLKRLKYFGWNSCVPGDSMLAFWWRADSLASGINSQTWNGPYYATKDTDSIALSGVSCARYFQYKADLWSQNTPSDIAVLYEVWVSYDTCQLATVEEKAISQKLTLMVVGNQIFLSQSKKLDNIELSIYNTAGELVQTVFKGSLDAKSYTFNPILKTKGVYLVVLKHSDNTEVAKMVKLK